MQYISYYDSLFGTILIAADDTGLSGIWFNNQRHFASCLASDHILHENKIITDTKNWLDAYFRGTRPFFTPPIHLIGTPYQIKIWNMLLQIPYAHTVTYQDLANKYALKFCTHTSARAVGGAVGRNPISIIIPCHRVVGSNGKMTGYAGGIDKKIKLLEHEYTFKHS